MLGFYTPSTCAHDNVQLEEDTRPIHFEAATNKVVELAALISRWQRSATPTRIPRKPPTAAKNNVANKIKTNDMTVQSDLATSHASVNAHE